MGRPTRKCTLGMADCRLKPLGEADLEAIERLARENKSETYRGPLLALVGEVRRLRAVVLGNGGTLQLGGER